jgi:hypothetical protein
LNVWNEFWKWEDATCLWRSDKFKWFKEFSVNLVDIKDNEYWDSRINYEKICPIWDEWRDKYIWSCKE